MRRTLRTEISPLIMAAGFRVSLIGAMYGIPIYALSLIIRMILKPRI